MSIDTSLKRKDPITFVQQNDPLLEQMKVEKQESIERKKSNNKTNLLVTLEASIGLFKNQPDQFFWSMFLDKRLLHPVTLTFVESGHTTILSNGNTAALIIVKIKGFVSIDTDDNLEGFLRGFDLQICVVAEHVKEASSNMRFVATFKGCINIGKVEC